MGKEFVLLFVFFVLLLVLRVIFFWGNFATCFFQSDDKWEYAFLFQILHIIFLHKVIIFSYNNIGHTFFTDSHSKLFSFILIIFTLLTSIYDENNLSFISNNAKEIQAISKRIKIFEYLKNYVTSNGFIFLQEIHSSIKDGTPVVLLLVLWVQRL